MDGLERLELSRDDSGIRASSVECWDTQGHGLLHLKRVGAEWHVNDVPRPDLDGAKEPDLSVTPFCNTPPIRRTPQPMGESLTLDTAFIDAPALTVARSRQCYIRQGKHSFRYVDLGLSRGFEADLQVDANGLVLSYEHLFQRISPS